MPPAPSPGHGGGSRLPAPPAVPDPAVRERARRRPSPAAHTLRLLPEAATCPEPGQPGALLRREGLYSSHLSQWRQQRPAGGSAPLAPRRRGRPAPPAGERELAARRRASGGTAGRAGGAPFRPLPGGRPGCGARAAPG